MRIKTTSMKKYSTNGSLLREIYKHRQIYVLLLPGILYFLIFHYVPMGGLVIAFEKFSITKGIFKSPFVGFEQFEKFFSDPFFWRLLKNTLALSSLSMLFSFPAPIIFALLLNECKNLRFKKTVQTITYVPHFISTVVVCSIILSFVSSDGLVNGIMKLFGYEAVNYMIEPKYFRTIYIISGIWQGLGWNSIIYISALAGIDQELYEAASIDGAGRWKRMLHITIPSLVPTMTILFIMQIGSLLSVGYEKIILLYNETIYETADVISTYVYRRGLINGDYSYSAAVGMFNSVVNLILLVMSNFICKKTTGNGLW